jgi:hypothetical protein
MCINNFIGTVKSKMVCTSKMDRYSSHLFVLRLIPFSECCAGKEGTTATVGWSFLWVIFFGLIFAGVGAYAVYKYRLRVKILCISQSPLYPLIFP